MMHCKSSSSIITHVVIVIILGRHGKSHDLVERINDSLIGILIPIRDGIITSIYISANIAKTVVVVTIIIIDIRGKSHDLVECINDSLIGILIPIRDGIIIIIIILAAPAAPAIRIGITTILVIPTTPCLISTAIGATGVGGRAGAPFGLTTREAVGQFVALGVGGGGHGENG
jgi:hypothetical protein